MIVWTEQYETGSAELDQQHRLLIDNINLLGDQLRDQNRTPEELEFAVHLVDYLEAYAKIHFQNEERCMKSARCPVFAENRAEHVRFLGFIGDYKRRCEADGFSTELLSELHRVIVNWIKGHILKVDTQLRPCLVPTIPRIAAVVPGQPGS